MTILLYAHPYDISAEGFFFRSVEEYEKQVTNITNQYGQQVEEFEIEFVDGGEVDRELARAMGLNQINIKRYFEYANQYEDHEKFRYIIAVGECGYEFDIDTDDIDLLDVDIYEEDNMKDLAIRFVEEGLYGEVPETFKFYIDYDAIACDLAIDYCEAVIAGQRMIYRCS